MAETFFTSHTTSILGEILEPEYNRSVGRAAAWADSYAHTSEGRFSYQWHWIDTHDWAPDSCRLNYNSDCAKEGCVVRAIANQTGILRECIQHVKSGVLKGGANLTCAYALKWVAHFVGDINQPLHASGRAAGGNLYKVKFGGVATVLHAVSGICSTPYENSQVQVWDRYIPYFAAKVDKPFSTLSLDPFFANLVSRIQRDQFYEAPSTWLTCSNPLTPEVCAARWASESNRWNCDYVYKNLKNDTDLGTDGYATGGVPIVELQISKAGLRLGSWLNKLVDSVPDAEVQEVLEL